MSDRCPLLPIHSKPGTTGSYIMRLRHLLGAVCAAAFLCGAGLSSAAIPAADVATAVEFHHAELDHYFVSADPGEISDLDTGKHPGWARTGYRFAVVKAGSTYPGTVPMCRFYNPTMSTHFYTAKPQECEDVKVKFADAWQFESGEVFRAFLVDPATGACPADTSATYRLYNKRPDSNHRYTNQISAFVYMVAKGYQPEGDGNPSLPVVFCTPTGGDAVPAASGSAPSCTVTASSPTPALGSTLALASACTNNPTAYLWVNCPSTDAKCSIARSAAGSVPYTLYSANDKGPGAPETINVVWGGASGVLPVCDVTASPAAPSTGSSLTLTATCSQTPTRYEWTECHYLIQDICNPIAECKAGTATCTLTTSIAGFHRYMVAGINGAGKGPGKALNVDWSQGGGNPGNPPPNPNDPPPVCTLYASETNPVIGTQIRLTASCNGSPSSIVWGDGTPCGNGIYCQAYSLTPGAATYSVYGVNGGGTGSTAYVTVNWTDVATPAAPVCTLTPSNAAPSVGTSITLNASCTGNPTSYTWTGCTSTTSSCSDSAATIGGKSYSVTATNASGTSQPASATVNWGAVPVQPPVCQVSASSVTPTVGQPITLTAVCTGSPTAYEWTNCTAPSTSSTCTATANVAAPVIYYVVGSNQYGASNAAGISVAWQSVPGGGGGGGTGLCAQYKDVSRFTLGWNDNTRKATDDFTSFGPDSVIAMELTVPPGLGSLKYAGYTAIYEYRGAPAIRIMTISKSACDFRNDDPSGVNGPFATVGGVLASIPWNVGPGGQVELQAGQTYYFNFMNYNCSGTCNAAIETIFPHN